MSVETNVTVATERTRVWLGTARVAALVLVGWSAVLQLTVGRVLPPVLAVGVVFAGLALVLGTARRWVGLVATILGLAAVGGNLPAMVEELSQPSSALAFILTLIATIAGLVLIVSGLGAFFHWPPRTGRLLWPCGAMILIGTALALVAASRVESVPVVDGDIVVLAKANEYSPDPLTATSGQVSIWVDNQDGARHTFTSYELGVDFDVVGLKSQRVEFTATPGEYVIFCKVTGHEQMTTTLVVN